MMKMKACFTLVASLLLSSGCQSKKILTEITMNDALKQLLTSHIAEGFYQINSKDKTYIFFRSIDSYIESIQGYIEDTTLIISASTRSGFLDEEVVYELAIDESIESIQLVIDNKESYFQSIILH